MIGRIGCGLLVAWLAGCEDFRTISADGVCGNLIVEPGRGEDCDTYPAGAGTACGRAGESNACRFVCAPSGEPRCPQDWACGLDGVCRASSGRLAAPVSSPLVVRPTSVRLADFDGDGRIDVFGRAASDVSIRFGDALGRFERRIAFSTDAPTGAAIVGRLDADAFADIVLPQSSGLLVARGSADGAFVPLAFAKSKLDTVWLELLLVRTAAADPRRTPLILVPGTRSDSAVLLDRNGNAVGEIGLGIPTAERGPGVIALADVDRSPSERGEELVFGLLGSRELLVATLDCQIFAGDVGCTLRHRSRVALPGIIVDGGLSLADLDGDGAIDLIIGLWSPELDRHLVATAYGDGAAGFRDAGGVAQRANVEPAFFAEGSGRVEPLAAGDLDGDRRADFVTRTGVYLTTSAAPLVLTRVAAARGGERWSHAAIADLNADGALDVAAASDLEPGVEVLIAAGRARFNPFRVRTREGTRGLVTADFDGDLVPDLALIQGDELWVAFGDRAGAPSGAAPMGRIGSVARMLAWTSDDQLDAIADLLVVSGAAGTRDLLLLFGSSQRQLLAPLVLPDGRAPRWVAHGSFFTEGASELLAFTAELDDDGPSEARAWLVKGAGGGRLRADHEELMSLSDCVSTISFDGAIGGAVRLGDSGLSGLVIVEGSVERTSRAPFDPRPIVIRPSEARCDRLPFVESSPATKTELADLDGDGLPDLLISYAGPPGAVVYWGSSGGAGFDPRPSVLSVDGAGVFGAAAIRADLDAAHEVALLAPGRLVVARIGRARRVFGIVQQIPLEVPPDAIVTAMDADGDGLEDVVIATGSRLITLLHPPCLAEEKTRGLCERAEPSP